MWGIHWEYCHQECISGTVLKDKGEGRILGDNWHSDVEENAQINNHFEPTKGKIPRE